MKRIHKIIVATIVSLALAFVFVTWAISPLIGPLTGLRRSTDEILEFIKCRNIVLLVDPVPVIKNENGTYLDWALAEYQKRRKAAALLWIAVIVPLGLWAARRQSGKNIDNKTAERDGLPAVR